jgi:hypothetical protein
LHGSTTDHHGTGQHSTIRQRADTYLLLMRISITERRSPGKIREKAVKTGRPMRG